MEKKLLFGFWITLLFCFADSYAQSKKGTIRMNTLPKDHYKAYKSGTDTIAVIGLREIVVFPPMKFKNERARRRYTKLIRDVKRTLPYAQMIYETLIETYEYIETLPDEDSKIKHLKLMEKELFKEYMPELKKLTLSQGKLLIKLINRECNQSSFNIVKAILGGFRAGFWNIFAGMFGASLKSDYDANGKEAHIERVVVLVERGLL
jgi:hypothetical protein